MISTNTFILVALVSVLAGVGLMAWVIDAGISEENKAKFKYGLFAMLAAIMGLFFFIEDDSEIEYSNQGGIATGGGGGGGSAIARSGGGGAGDSKVVEKKSPDQEKFDAKKTEIVREEPDEDVIKTAHRDCEVCPEFVIIEPGSAVLGSVSPTKSGGLGTAPNANVIIRRPYGIGKYEVTVDQFSAFVSATGYTPAKACRIGREVVRGASFTSPGYIAKGSMPAACIAWTDAQNYADWLSRKTGYKYRLPTEIEWEFAARSGTAGRFVTGSSITSADARFSGGQAGRASAPAAIGSFEPNKNAMHDVHGNVWELTADCWSPVYQRGGSGRSNGCANRIAKGGGWFSKPQHLDLAIRAGLPSTVASNGIGFRIVREPRDKRVTIRRTISKDKSKSTE